MLQPPVRNKYFYGKLLDVRHFDLEQTYLNRKRWLVNRLAIGSGVLCGLEVEATDDGKLVIRPGVAVDGLGREIVVSAAPRLENPRQPTDDCGRPSGDPLGEGYVTICLAYHECETEPAPVLVGDCDTRLDCAASAVVERFKLLVHSGLPASPGTITPEQCTTIFPASLPDDINRRVVACGTLERSCAVPDETCVVLATVALPADTSAPLEVDQCTYRSVLYSNANLLDLVFCLAARVDRCCRTRILRYVGGDAQQADAGADLPQPFEVEVVDGEGQPVADEQVTFEVRGGGGGVSEDGASFTDSVSAPSDASGRAKAAARLGPNAGLDTYEASIASGSRVVFHALGTAEKPPPPDLPDVEALWVPNATVLTPEADDLVAGWLKLFSQSPHIELTFDREMDETDLDKPDAWLRLHQLLLQDEKVRVRRLPLKRIQPPDPPTLGVHGFTVAYGFDPAGMQGRFLVQIRAEGASIVDKESPAVLLDAEFEGTKLATDMLDTIWTSKQNDVLEIDFWNAFVDTGAKLPSGDGTPGGRLHSWFEIENIG